MDAIQEYGASSSEEAVYVDTLQLPVDKNWFIAGNTNGSQITDNVDTSIECTTSTMVVNFQIQDPTDETGKRPDSS